MDSDTERDENNEQTHGWKGVSGTLFLLNMHDPLKTDSPKQSHAATCETLKAQMRVASSNLIGVCFYGTNKPCDAGIEGVRQMIPLTAPNLDDFLAFQGVRPSAYGLKNDFKLSDALWHANKMFANCKKLLSTKTVILLTRMDIAPIESDQKPTLKRVVDLVDSGVYVKIVNVSKTEYHVDQFYKTLLTEANKGKTDFTMPKPIWEINNMLNEININMKRHLANAHISFNIGEGVSIGVGVYNLIKSSSSVKPKKRIVDKDTNQILSSVRTVYKKTVGDDNQTVDDDEGGDEDSGDCIPLLKSEMLFHQTFGGEQIEFDAEEVKLLRNPFGPPQLKLLGFKPSSILRKEMWFIKPCHFIYPSESFIEGSTVAFKALHKACTDMSVVAIGVCWSRANTKPKMVALSPCTKPLHMENIEIGFDVIPLPYSENIRNLHVIDNDVTVTEPLKNFMKEMIKDLKFDYKPDMFEMPHIQRLYRQLEALAFEEESIEPYEDNTLLDLERYQNVPVKVFDDLFGPIGKKGVDRKRPHPEPLSDVPLKAQKAEIDEDLLKERLRCKLIHRYNNLDLRKILAFVNGGNRNVPRTKPLLVQKVYDDCAGRYS